MPPSAKSLSDDVGRIENRVKDLFNVISNFSEIFANPSPALIDALRDAINKSDHSIKMDQIITIMNKVLIAIVFFGTLGIVILLSLIKFYVH